MMYKYYHVCLGNKHMDIVKALNEQDAVNQVLLRFGNASKYKTNENYRAIEA